jgi:hypothetical protein
MKVSKKNIGQIALVGVAIAGAAAAAPPATKQVVTGPVATYWMSAQTNSGFTMGGAGAQRPSLGSMMMGGMGGGDNVSKSLHLELGSSRKATGEPSAEHLPPSVLKAGASLPLLSPKPTVREPVERETNVYENYEQPKGKMLIYWGCGERARAGQPLVFDFAKMAKGQIPAGYQNLMTSLQVTAARGPAAGRNATYGEWPNEKTRTSVPGDGSLLGQHTIRGNYSPQIQFTMAQGQDFLPAVNMSTNRKNPTGSFQLGWQPVTGATGYIASTMGGDGETFVVWSSSEVQSLLFALPDYLTPGDVQRLLANKALMQPTQTSCTVPKEVVDAAPSSMYQFVAYGGESNFSYPPRPADPKQAWNIEWTVKVRYRSATGGILGMENPYGGGEGDSSSGSSSDGGKSTKKPKKPKGSDILRGLGVPIPGL